MKVEIAEDDQGSRIFLAAIAGGDRVGRATLDFSVPRERGRTLFRNAWVDPAWRSRGIGSALVRRAEEVAAARGYDALDLLVRLDNPRALDLYRRLGYAVVGEEVNRYVADGGEVVEEHCWSLRKALGR